MKRYFLGLAAGLGTKEIWRHVFTIGREEDRRNLAHYLEKKYDGQAILTKNGRSALALALKALLSPGDAVLVNGFTCYAVFEAIEAAGMRPVWADISPRDLNFTVETLNSALQRSTGTRAIIIQNTLGNPVDIAKIEKFAKKHELLIIEDLAHSAGITYADGRKAGTVGAATVFSFGKDKVVDATSGGAVVLRGEQNTALSAPEAATLSLGAVALREEQSTSLSAHSAGYGRGLAREPRDDGRERRGAERDGALFSPPTKPPRPSDVLRARFYPLFGVMVRWLTGVHLGGVLMRLLLKIHWIERSADNRLDLDTKIAKFEAKLALERLKRLPHRGRRPLRTFYLVNNRERALRELQQNGYYFNSFWYEKPVAPARYYKKVRFPEHDCPVATELAKEIVNFPNYYNARELLPARKIIETYVTKVRLTNRGVLEQIKEVALKNAREGGRLALDVMTDKLAEKITDKMGGKKS